MDEVIILDTGSVDNTLEIAGSYPNVKIHTAEFTGFGQLKNHAVTLAKNDWIFSVDSDEVASEELISDLERVIQNEKNIGVVNRINYYNGKAIKGANWRNDQIPRVFNRKNTTFNFKPVHEEVLVKNLHPVHLKGDLHHYAFHNVSDIINKIQFYSTLFAKQNRYKKKIPFFLIGVKTVVSFIKNYFIKGGLFYGKEGFLISVSNCIGVFYKYIKLHEENNSLKVSLIITTYNRKEALELVLKSVLKQSVMPKEVIIGDDGSREDTANLISSYKEKFPIPLIHCWHEDKGFRLSEIRNLAIRNSSYEYLIMVDGDVILHRDFIKSHMKAAEKGFFIQGSRVLLSEAKTQKALLLQKMAFGWFEKGVENRLNAISSGILSTIFIKKSKSYLGVRGCNMAFWKEDVEMVNGFNEDFTGWGREDSEFVVRLINNGIYRKNLKFRGVVYHLYHQENNRRMLPQNDLILQNAIEKKLKYCENGLNRCNIKKEVLIS